MGVKNIKHVDTIKAVYKKISITIDKILHIEFRKTKDIVTFLLKATTALITAKEVA